MRRKSIFIFLIAAFLIVSLEKCKRETTEPTSPPKEDVQANVILDEEASKIAAIKTEKAQVKSFSISIKAAGEVRFNQERLVHITARVPGRIEKVNAFEAEKVERGQELLSLYSPDFLAAQTELIQIDSRFKRMQGSPDKEGEKITAQMLDSAKAKLRLIGINEEELNSLKETHEIMPLLILRSPFKGSIIESKAISGTYVEMGSPLFKIADLATLWVMASIYEKDISLVKPNSRAKVQVGAFPYDVFEGRLASIGDVLDEETRTVKGRVEVGNSSGKLKPGMYADVRLFSPEEFKALVVPEKAVRRIEGKSIVFVPKENHSFEMREIQTGRSLEGFVEIIRGLKDGERVVTEGSFDLKSEVLKKTLEGEEE